MSGALALDTLTHLNKYFCLVIIVVAQIVIAIYGHNMVHVFEKFVFPLLVIAFGLGAIWTFGKAHYGHIPQVPFTQGGIGGFTLTLGATFGYAAGWNPVRIGLHPLHASGHEQDGRRPGGAASAWPCRASRSRSWERRRQRSPAPAGWMVRAPFVHPYPTVVRDLVLLSIAVGAVAANVLNIYSGSMSFVDARDQAPALAARADRGGRVRTGRLRRRADRAQQHQQVRELPADHRVLDRAWLAVFFTDQFLRRGNHADLLYDPKHVNWAGPIAMLVGMAVSIPLFANQYPKFIATIPTHHPAVGDLTFEVGFAVSAIVYAVLYYAGLAGTRPRSGSPT